MSCDPQHPPRQRASAPASNWSPIPGVETRHGTMPTRRPSPRCIRGNAHQVGHVRTLRCLHCGRRLVGPGHFEIRSPVMLGIFRGFSPSSHIRPTLRSRRICAPLPSLRRSILAEPEGSAATARWRSSCALSGRWSGLYMADHIIHKLRERKKDLIKLLRKKSIKYNVFREFCFIARIILISGEINITVEDLMDQDVPAQHFSPSVRSYPAVLPPIEYDQNVLIRKVEDHGQISFMNKNTGN